MEQARERAPGALEVPARLALFGYEPTPARAVLRARSRRWRMAGAARTQALGILLAPLVGLVPPHAPWALGAVGVGFLLARRRWRHHFTLEGVVGACPRCGAPVSCRAGMLRSPHTVPCEACRHEATLEVDPAAYAPRPGDDA